jgi:hypothetical protein
MSTTTPSSQEPTQPSPPIRPAEVLAAQDAMDQQAALREGDHAELNMEGLRARLPRLAPAAPADLDDARTLSDQQLAARVADATGRLLQLPGSLHRYQPHALQQERQARAQAQAATVRARQLRQDLERRGWLRRLLQPQATARLRQQLEQAEQQRTQAGERLRAAQVRVAAVEDRQQERGRRVAVERTWLREGAAAVLVLGERAMARDLGQRDPTRHHDRDQQRAERGDPGGPTGSGGRGPTATARVPSGSPRRPAAAPNADAHDPAQHTALAPRQHATDWSRARARAGGGEADAACRPAGRLTVSYRVGACRRQAEPAPTPTTRRKEPAWAARKP